MKQGTSVHLPVKFSGVTMANVSQIEFVFKQRPSRSGEALKTSVYKSDGSGDVQMQSGSTDTVLVPWSKADTEKFAAGDPFYMDTRITMSNSADNPDTGEAVELWMCRTLFEEAET